MKVIYLGHSGFLVESERACYLFDYIRGGLPASIGEKPLYIFVSHAHEDHFNMGIFRESFQKFKPVYILGRDIRRKVHKKEEIIYLEQERRLIWAKPHEEIALTDCRIYPLKSTDQGVAFMVSEPDGTKVYHAGDLNWWYWEEESYSWNRNMEVCYKREMEHLKGQKFKAAFVPLDPRQEAAYWLGMDYFIQQTEAEHVFPMHFWEDYDVIRRFQREHGPCPCVEVIEKEGQQYII